MYIFIFCFLILFCYAISLLYLSISSLFRYIWRILKKRSKYDDQYCNLDRIQFDKLHFVVQLVLRDKLGNGIQGRGGGRSRNIFKFSDGEGPNLCRVKKVDVSSTFIENIFRSGLTLVSSNDVITVEIDIKKKLKTTRK